MAVNVRALSVDDAAALGAFLDLPTRVYAEDTHFCPPDREGVAKQLLTGQQERALRAMAAYEAGDLVARLAAQLNPRLLDEGGRPYGCLGFFEALNRPQAAGALLREGAAYLRELGARRVIGPMNGDTWHTYRVNVGPFDARPFLMEPYNPPYYAALWEGAGFATLRAYHSKCVEDCGAAAARFERIRQRVLSRGYVFERFDLDRYGAELDRLYDLSVAIFADNYLYTPITREAFHAHYAAARALPVPDLAWFVRAPGGEDAGFVFAFPDCFETVRAMRLGLPDVPPPDSGDTVNIKTLGIVERHRGKGLASALMCQAYDRAETMGLRRANLCLFRDDNPSRQMDGGLGEISRTYLLYEYTD